MTGSHVRLGFAVLIVALAVAGRVGADSFDEGFTAFISGDYKTAFSEWRPLAEAGDIEAQFGLGMLYERGRGVARDIEEAARWFHRAAEQGSMRAQTQIAGMYARGDGVDEDWDQAIAWWRKAAAQGSVRAQFHLGQAYQYGSGVERDLETAETWYAEAAAQGYRSAEVQRGEVARLMREEAAAMAALESAAVTAGAAAGAAATDGGAEGGVTLALALPEPSTVYETGEQLDDGRSAGAALLIPLSPGQASTPGRAHRVYLASFRGIGEAEAGWRRLAGAHHDLLAGLDPVLAQVDLGRDKGIFYRLQAGPLADAASAEALCKQLIARAAHCLALVPN